EHSLPGNAKLEAGFRYSSANSQAALTSVPAPGTTGTVDTVDPAASTESASYTTARLKLTVPVPGVPQADVYGLVEQGIAGTSGREVGVGGNYAVNQTTKLYLRHDFINSLH